MPPLATVVRWNLDGPTGALTGMEKIALTGATNFAVSKAAIARFSRFTQSPAPSRSIHQTQPGNADFHEWRPQVGNTATAKHLSGDATEVYREGVRCGFDRVGQFDVSHLSPSRIPKFT